MGSLHDALENGENFAKLKSLSKGGLFSKPADINELREGYTPLRRAVLHGYYDSAAYLMSQPGCIIDAEVLDTALHGISQSKFFSRQAYRDVRILCLLMRHCSKDILSGNGNKILHEIMESSNSTGDNGDALDLVKDILKFLVAAGVSLNETYKLQERYKRAADNAGKTILMRVLSRTYFSDDDYQESINKFKLTVVRFLIELGARPDKKQDDGRTLLMQTVLLTQERSPTSLKLLEYVTETLLQQGGSLDDQDNKGMTALMYAPEAWGNYKTAIHYLITKGCSLAKRDNEGNTAFLFVCRRGNLEVVRYLLEYNKDLLQDKNDDGDTPLLIAVANGHVDVASYFLKEKGCSLQETNKKGLNVFDYAHRIKEKGKGEIAEVEKIYKERGQAMLDYLNSVKEQQSAASSLSSAASNQPLTQQVSLPISRLLETTFSNIKLGNVLGEGSFGTVYQGEWQNMNVAVKILKASTLTAQVAEDFTKETSIMISAPHDNIVRLFAVFTQPYGFIMEYVSGGSLYAVLHSDKELDWNNRKIIALDIAYGLSYLHSKDILHRDLKSLNILITESGHAKLTDFGLATVKKATHTSTSTVAGTLLWMAPELFKRGGKHSSVTDVYSYGVVLSELATRKVPFEDEETTNQSLIMQWIEKGKHDPIPQDCPTQVKSLMMQCWDLQPEKRPALANVIQQLRTTGEGLEYRDNLESLASGIQDHALKK